MPERVIRVLIAKPGLDSQDCGARMEVISTGLCQTPAMAAATSDGIADFIEAIATHFLYRHARPTSGGTDHT